MVKALDWSQKFLAVKTQFHSILLRNLEQMILKVSHSPKILILPLTIKNLLGHFKLAEKFRKLSNGQECIYYLALM